MSVFLESILIRCPHNFFLILSSIDMHHLSGNEETEVAAISAENDLEHEIPIENETVTADNEHDDVHADATDSMATAENVASTETGVEETNGNETADIEHVKSDESDGNQNMAESTEEPNEAENTSDHNERDTNFDNEENGIEKVGARNLK